MILLDTHAWIWWLTSPKRLSTRARSAIENSPRIGLSPISAWEVATRVQHGKLRLDREPDVWLQQALATPRLETVPLTAGIAWRAGLLGALGFHGDPADRMIAATALESGIAVITKDRLMRDFDALLTIW